MTQPERLEFGLWFDGKSHPIWHYKEVPEGMRIATLKDMYYGRPFLAEVLLGPHKGDYYTGYYVGKEVAPVRYRITHGMPVYIKD